MSRSWNFFFLPAHASRGSKSRCRLAQPRGRNRVFSRLRSFAYSLADRQPVWLGLARASHLSHWCLSASGRLWRASRQVEPKSRRESEHESSKETNAAARGKGKREREREKEKMISRRLQFKLNKAPFHLSAGPILIGGRQMLASRRRASAAGRRDEARKI